MTRRVVLLWHHSDPVGICVFAAPAAALRLRSHFFGLKQPRSGLALAALNRQLWLLQRLVLHPTYRGAGIASAFVRRACELCDVDWIETLSAMGRTNPIFERAGFTRVGMVRKDAIPHDDPRRFRFRFSEPVYFIFDNRGQAAHP